MRVCSAHFFSWSPSDDPLHVDWAPSIIGSRSKSREVGEASRDRLERAKGRATRPLVLCLVQVRKCKQLQLQLLNLNRQATSARTTTPAGSIPSNMEDSDSLSEVLRADLEEEVRVLRRKVQQLEEECRYLRTLEEKVIKLEDEVQCLCKSKMSAKLIAGDDHMTKFYTGLPTHVVFLSLFTYLEGKASRMRLWRGEKEEEKRKQEGKGAGGRKGGRKLELVDEFFMTLIRLRLGLYSEDIAQRFGISVSYFSKIFTTWIVFLSKEVRLLFPFPSQKKINTKNYWK